MKANALIPPSPPFILVAERVGPIFAKMQSYRLACRAYTRLCVPPRRVRAMAGLESGFHPECGDYDSTSRQAEFPSDWLESENRSKLTSSAYANAR